jgi:hypothetical protein
MCISVLVFWWLELPAVTWMVVPLNAFSKSFGINL